MIRPAGFHPAAFDAYIRACSESGINPAQGKRPNGTIGGRVMQTIGDAEASKGFHAANGRTQVDGKWESYCACTDTRSTDLSDEQCLAFWKAMMKQGFAIWWRRHGSFSNNQHFHFVWPGCVIGDTPGKENGKKVRAQIHSYLKGNTGLAGGAPEPFLKQHLTESMEQRTRSLFLANNRPVGASPTTMVQDLALEEGHEKFLCEEGECVSCGEE